MTDKDVIVPMFEMYYRRARWAALLGLGFFTVFTAAQSIAFFYLGDNTVLDPDAGLVSVILNFAVIVAISGFYLVNFSFGPRKGWNREETYRWSIHGVCSTVMAIAVGHVHVAGSATTVLPIMFVVVSLLVLWLAGLRASWFYFFAGLAGWATVYGLESLDILTYFPLHAQRLKVHKDIFLESRYFWMTFALFLANGAFILSMTHYYARQLQIRNAQLDASNLELSRTNENLRLSEELRRSLTGMIVHDLRSPLAGVRLDLQSAGRKIEPDSPLREKLHRSLDGTSALLELINCLLDVDKSENGKLELSREAVSLRAVIDGAIESLGGLTDGRRLRVETPDPAPAPVMDAALVRRVVANLLANALKFTPPSGEIRIGVGLENGAAVVSVADDGPGIPPEYHAKIFEKFGQAELRGESKNFSTGLGLAFCKMAVEAHGGRIGVDSRVGQGTTFRFSIPINPEPAA